MLEALFEGLLLVLQWKAFGFMLLGIGLGFWVGLLPGLGGATTLALMLPFIYTMQPVEAFAFLLGMHAVVATTGDITSVLFGVPGEATSAATVVDGYADDEEGRSGARARRGARQLAGRRDRRRGRARRGDPGGAAAGADLRLARALHARHRRPRLHRLAQRAGRARHAARLHRRRRSGCCSRPSARTRRPASPRFTFDTLYLWQGLDLVPVLVGIFAIPEIIDLVVRGTSIAGNAPPGKRAPRARGKA